MITDMIVLFHTVATGHVAIMTEGTEFKLLFHFNLNNHMWIVAPIR